MRVYHMHMHNLHLLWIWGRTPTQHVYCEQARFARPWFIPWAFSHTYARQRARTFPHARQSRWIIKGWLTYTCGAWQRWMWLAAGATSELASAHVSVFYLRSRLLHSFCSVVFSGSGHLHGEGRGPVLHLSLLPADPAQRLCPRPGHLFQHRVH